MIDRATIDRIMDATNIVDVVSDFVTLKKRGINYIGLCPFHNDTHPSFSVSPSRGICHCFTCGKGGNAVNFLMELENLSYPDALRWLARKYNIEIHEKELTAEEKKEESDREAMFLVNEWALKYFENILHNDVDGIAIGLQYFRSRGFRDDTIKKFHLGYALQNRHAMSDAALKAGYKEEFLIKTGLCYKRDNGELIDRFAGRVIFPWFSLSGKVVGFNGRVLDSRTHGVMQKYVNSPDSEIYHKGNELFGLNQAKQAIRKADSVILVEGQADVISMSQNTVENVVAGSGTALTANQVRKLHRFTDNITLIYDGDDAGVNAALRNSDLIHGEGMNVSVLFLPDGQDPDDFAKSHTPEQLQEFIAKNSTDSIIFRIDRTIKGVTDPIKRSQAINDVVSSIAIIKDPILRDTYIRECAQRTGVPEATLIGQMNRVIRRSMERRTTPPDSQASPGPSKGGEMVNTGINTGAATNVASISSPLGRQGEATGASTSVTSISSPLGFLSPDNGGTEGGTGEASGQASVSSMLIEAVIRHGNEIIFKDIKDDNSGKTISLNVAQYIAYDLGLDNLSFTNPLYNTILKEAVEKSSDPSFVAINYFTHHPDIRISTLASNMGAEKYQLSESLQIKNDTESLRSRVLHMVLDFRLDYVNRHLKELQKQIFEVSDATEQMKIMAEIKKMQEVRNILAQKLGKDIV